MMYAVLYKKQKTCLHCPTDKYPHWRQFLLVCGQDHSLQSGIDQHESTAKRTSSAIHRSNRLPCLPFFSLLLAE
ncbi:hypothetical protein DsansV1_C01g0005341 [Dioscorea sansibarensis]